MEIGEQLGGGSFGQVFYASNASKGQEYAIKIESEDKRNHLFTEYRFLKYLQGGIGIPKVYFESDYGSKNAFTMQLLGSSLENLFQKCGRKFSLKTVLMLADQMLQRIQYIHEKGILHRDIKPDNFAIGIKDNSTTLYLIDFGISHRYIDPKTRQHIPYREGRQFCGTTRYGSINDHIGIECSRRDDLESLAYTLIYLAKGYLPWQNLKSEKILQKRELDEVMQAKLTLSVEDLCSGLPIEFSAFLSDVRKLDFESRPKYELYRHIFRSLFINMGFTYDNIYDWDEKPLDNVNISKLPPISSKIVNHITESENTTKEHQKLHNSNQHSKSTLQFQSSSIRGKRLSLQHNLTFHKFGIHRPH